MAVARAKGDVADSEQIDHIVSVIVSINLHPTRLKITQLLSEAREALVA